MKGRSPCSQGEDYEIKESQVHPLALGQGLFYLLSGLWPVFHTKSFEKVTGPKTDEWLVKAVGILIAVTGANLLRAGACSNKIPREVAGIAAGQAVALGGVSLYYSAVGRISKIYLADSLVEGLLAFLWFISRKEIYTEEAEKGASFVNKISQEAA